MDKQKQIEEMAKVLDGYWHTNTRCPFDKKCPYLGGQVRFTCSDCLRVNVLINAGYRKIPEGAVVLTREEYNELCCSIGVSREEVDRVVDLVKKDTRKETAEKFAEMLNEEDCSIPIKDDFIIILRKDIDEICKELTEGM